MKKSIIKNLLVIMIILLSGVISGCSRKNTTESTVIIGTTQSIEQAVYGEYNYDVLSSGVSEIPLVYQNSQGDYAGLLCDYSTKDAKTWTLTVKDGMTWSDGVAVTAEDILFTLQYEDKNGSANLVDQATTSQVTAKKYESYQLSEDKRSISLTLVTANVRELANMTTFRIAPKHVLESDDTNKDSLRVTCGPYVLTSFDAENGTLTYDINPYYPVTPKVSHIVYQIYANEDLMYTALNRGEIDATWIYSQGVTTSYSDILKDNTALNSISIATTSSPAVLAFNNHQGLCSNKNIRLAISYALNYNTFKSTFGSSEATITKRGFVSPSTLGYYETEDNTYNLTKAQNYMTEAGYERHSDGFYYQGETLCTLNLTVNSSKALHVRYAELVKTQLEYFGIKVNLNSLDATAYNAVTSNKFSNHNITMEAAIYGFTAAGMGMGAGLGTIYVDGNHAVQGGCQVYDTTFQTALAQLTQATTLEDYKLAAQAIQSYYAENIPMIALYQDSQTYFYNNRLSNITVDAVFGLNNINNWLNINLNK